MIRRYQSRTGEHGNCFATSLANILNDPNVPEFGINVSEDQYWANVARYLARYGLKYERVPITKGLEPVGWSTIEGVSPRGGLHACVALNGKLVWDPHPIDGTKHGLAKPMYYGLLEKL
jgi:hypothetical protein